MNIQSRVLGVGSSSDGCQGPSKPETQHNSVPVWHSVPLAESISAPALAHAGPVLVLSSGVAALLPSRQPLPWTCPQTWSWTLELARLTWLFRVP